MESPYRKTRSFQAEESTRMEEEGRAGERQEGRKRGGGGVGGVGEG